MHNNLIHFLPALIVLLAIAGIMIGSSREQTAKTNRLTQPLGLLAVGGAAALQFMLILRGYESSEAYGGFDFSLLSQKIQLVVFMITAYCLVWFDQTNSKHYREQILLVLFSCIAAALLTASTNIISFYLLLEFMSLAAYGLLISSNQRPPVSLGNPVAEEGLLADAAIKYFFIGTLASALLLFGLALHFGYTGNLSLLSFEIIAFFDLKAVSLILIFLAFAIKIGLVPFHFWSADVYTLCRSKALIFLTTGYKLALVYSFYKLFGAAFSGSPYLTAVIWILLVLTMLGGSLVAVSSSTLKKIMAGSAIANSGYLSVIFIAADNPGFQSAFFFYLLTYTLFNLIIFSVLSFFESRALVAGQLTIPDLTGVSREHPLPAAALAVAAFGLAALPPVFVGTFSKLYLFRALIEAEYFGLTAFFILSSVIAAFYYLRIVIAMFGTSSESARPASGVLSSSPDMVSASDGQVSLGVLQKLSLWSLIGLTLYGCIFPSNLIAWLS